MRVTAASAELGATLNIPRGARGIVLFAHGSGSSRFSPRNRAVAQVLQDAGLATLLLDLLTEEEERADELTREHRFDIPLLSDRLVGAIDWTRAQESTAHLQVGLFGASTGAAAALIAAARRPELVKAVVSRGGRPDLAGDILERVVAPTLLIVGERDREVIELNRQAARRMTGPRTIEIVRGATHLFEEPGALDRVAALARDWFERLLSAATPTAPHPWV
jgi:dienelactone hydrolase